MSFLLAWTAFAASAHLLWLLGSVHKPGPLGSCHIQCQGKQSVKTALLHEVCISSFILLGNDIVDSRPLTGLWIISLSSLKISL